jgi:P4 family phage/plasmid primase-like protien
MSAVSGSAISATPRAQIFTSMVDAGRSLTPVDGATKKPAWWVLPLETDPTTGEVLTDPKTGKPKHTWKPYQQRRPTVAELHTWASDPRVRLATVYGKVSNHAELMDFDKQEDEATDHFEEFFERVRGRAPELAKRLTVWLTPRKGHHVPCCCPDAAIPGNQVLAYRYKLDPNNPKDDEVKALIETRGEGGYGLCPPSAGYTLLQGDAVNLPIITKAERELLHTIAREFTEGAPRAEQPAGTSGSAARAQQEGERPGDTYNRRASVRDVVALLERAGATVTHSAGGSVSITRPGKSPHEGVSATVKEVNGTPIFYNFSSSWTPFEAGHGYSPYQVYALLEHAGDWSAAARALARELRPAVHIVHAQSEQSGGERSNDADAVAQYEHTDLGNGERFADTYASELTYTRYGSSTGDWRWYDGARWVLIAQDELLQRAGQVARQMYLEAAKQLDTDVGKALAKHALRSQSEGRLQAVVNLAKNKLGTWAKDFDADPWLLNCPNGTLDLRTGTLRPHRREDYLTKMAGAAYNPQAECSTFTSFFQTIQPDAGDRSYIQQVAGYSLTSITREQALFFLNGSGSNGKTTLINILRHIMGDYATTARMETFMAKQGEGGINNDIADLMGARMVSTSELEDGKRLAESLIKDLTGQDRVKARFLYKEAFEFVPVFKLWMAGNHKPAVRGTDEGIWRRIRLIPFTVQISDERKDKNLPEKLQREASGILRWAVQGCLSWQKHGLITPAAVTTATGQYRQEMDVLAAFLEDACEVKEGARVPKKNLYAVYRRWAEEAEEFMWSSTMFGKRMNERGFAEDRTGGERLWQNLRILDPH